MIMEDIKSYFDKIEENNVTKIYKECDPILSNDFLTLFFRFKVYERIPKERIEEIIDKLEMSPNIVLSYKPFVEYFSLEIKQQLMKPEFGAEFFAEYYLEEKDQKKKQYFPIELTKEDIYKTVETYINYGNVNPNVLNLIINSKSMDSKKFLTDDKLRYRAKKRYEKYFI